MDLFWLTIVLFLVAAILRSELFFYLLYVLVGLQVISRLWLRRSTKQIHWRRKLAAAAFPGERVDVELEIHNSGLLPISYLTLNESLPPALHTPPTIRQVLSLGADERTTLRYTLVGTRRGFYRIGPLRLRTGDVLGLGERDLSDNTTHDLTIYPTVLSLGALGLPATLPYGTLPAQRRLFADPARPAGVRPYTPGDDVRQIDWKSSARVSAPLVRRRQPAIAVEALVALAFSRQEYGGRYDYDTIERALVASASICAHLSRLEQPVGLVTNGTDPARPGEVRYMAGTGRAHLIELLGALGRLELPVEGELMPLLLRASGQLGWGGTVVVITGRRGPELVAELLPLRRRGLNVALVLTDPTPEELGLPRQHGIKSYGLWRDGRPRAG